MQNNARLRQDGRHIQAFDKRQSTAAIIIETTSICMGDLIDGKEVKKDEEDIVSKSPRERGCFLG